MPRIVFSKRFSILSLVLVIALVLNGQPALVSAQSTCLPLCVVSGKVGIGTKTPTAQLDVVGDLKVNRVSGQDGRIYMAGDLIMLPHPTYGDGGVALSHDVDDSLVINAVNTFPGGVRIQSGVTIGRPTTPAGLQVIGAATIDGPVTVNGPTTTKVLKIMGGSDLAEPFDIANTDAIQPGMVVAIDPANPGQLRLADAAYDHTVAGVVSGAGGINPGLILQQEGSVAAGEHPVALTGRVYVYADATNGAIEPGDLLTTSATPGHAMKVTDHDLAQGAILGKAMSKLEEGTGLVLLLVTLQ